MKKGFAYGMVLAGIVMLFIASQQKSKEVFLLANVIGIWGYLLIVDARLDEIIKGRLK